MEDGNAICNFIPSIAGIYEPASGEGTVVVALEMQQENFSVPLQCNIKELDKMEFPSISPRFLCQDENGKSTKKVVTAYIKKQIAEYMVQHQSGVLFDRFGWEILPDGNHVYIAGDRVIGKIENIPYLIALTISAVTLPDLPDQNDILIIKNYMNTLERAPNVLIPLSAHLLRSLLSSVFALCGYSIHHVLYILSRQGMGKTTAAKNFCLPFCCTNAQNDAAFFLRALGSKAAVRDALTESRDVAVLLDDICTSSDSQTQREAKSLVGYVIRFAADNTPVERKVGNKNISCRCQCGVIITGELPMRTASDITRCAMVQIPEQMIDGKTNDHLTTAAAMLRFLQHCAINYDNIVAEIKESFVKFDPNAVEDSSPRQQRILAELSFSFRLFLRFAEQTGALTEVQKARWEMKLQSALEASLQVNNQILRDFNTKNVTNIAELIVSAIKSGGLKLADDLDEFHNYPKQYDGFKKKGFRCIKLESIAYHLTNLTGRHWTKSQVGQKLRECGLVEPGKEGHTASCKYPGVPRTVPLHWKTLRKQAGMMEKP